MHMGLSLGRHTQFMTNKLTGSIRQKGSVGQTVCGSQIFKVKVARDQKVETTRTF